MCLHRGIHTRVPRGMIRNWLIIKAIMQSVVIVKMNWTNAHLCDNKIRMAVSDTLFRAMANSWKRRVASALCSITRTSSRKVWNSIVELGNTGQPSSEVELCISWIPVEGEEAILSDCLVKLYDRAEQAVDRKVRICRNNNNNSLQGPAFNYRMD